MNRQLICKTFVPISNHLYFSSEFIHKYLSISVTTDLPLKFHEKWGCETENLNFLNPMIIVTDES